MFRNAGFNILLSVLLIVVIAVSVTTFSPAASADKLLGQLLKTFGIGFVVSEFAEPIDNFINTLTFNNGVQVETATKVVPIVTVGSGTFAGAVQVSGPAAEINKVQAVAQLEGDFRDGTFRIRALVPVNTKNPIDIKNIDRIEGVGVTALIDVDV
ncbi:MULTISPECIES: hypothetical protein [unclassified Halanaerobium]|uniref:hypothetical protein n=1 Tax=unclassified Halanaerobium TaxID=2641197 RepID=UPI000DF15D75|nr:MULTISPECIES: hypothetical protein [unclassified Halanaerobium]RCW50457.1 hypothetical protein DFR78_10333 [Halanaerobium sp. MA284_MarDTE_T2]RCW84198.1 hypothetical protein DER71_1142 [Halanaerobium sp. DL-01]